MKINWLDRRIAAPGPYLCLCLSEDEYLAAFKHLKVNPIHNWIKNAHANATTHYIENAGNRCIAAVVCLQVDQGRNPIEIAGLLVHEAVHVWQYYCEYYGETRPAEEQEAYAIQAVAQELMAEYARRLGEKK